MLICAGILFRAADGTCLVLRRSGEGDCAGLWDLPGGKVEEGEDLASAALREAEEEIGVAFDHPGTVLMRRVVDGVDYTTFLCPVPAPFLPSLNDEHDGFAWVRPADALADQPPGMVPPTIQAAPMVNVPSVEAIADKARADADFKEADHPRAADGKFGAGSKVRIVTSHDPDSGETTLHHVGDDKDAAQKAFEDVSDDDDVEHEPELHEEKVRGKKGERSDALHIVHSGDGAAGVNIHGAHTSPGAARGQAQTASQAEWAESGPRRSEAGLSDLEKIDVAQAWNDDHAGDNDDVRIKVDADGDPVLDDDGDFQFEQDGEDVNPTDDHLAALAAVQDELYPGDDAAAYPGLDDANAHFEGEGEHDKVFRVHEHRG